MSTAVSSALSSYFIDIVTKGIGIPKELVQKTFESKCAQVRVLLFTLPYVNLFNLFPIFIEHLLLSTP